MSSTIRQAIEALKGRIADAYTAISAKGGTLPAQPTAANLPDAIASIPAGGAQEYDFITYYPNLIDPMKVLSDNISNDYPSGVCYVVNLGVDIDIPQADKVILADGTIGQSGNAQTIPSSEDETKKCTYIICLYSSRATITEYMNNANLLAIAIKNADITPVLSSASKCVGAMFDSCALTFSTRHAIGSYMKYWKDTNCSYTISANYSNIFEGTYIYLYTDANFSNAQYNNEIFMCTCESVFLPNITGNYLATQGGWSPFQGGHYAFISMPLANTFPNFRNGEVNIIKLGVITFVDTWTMNTLSGLKYIEIGEGTDIDMNVKNSHIYTELTSTNSGVELINKNIVEGIGNKIKDNSGTGVTRVFTLPASVYAILTNDTKAVFTNKGWTIAGA